MNPQVSNVIPSGTLLGGKYQVIELMPLSTPEADYYCCHCQSVFYMAKVYRGTVSTSSPPALALIQAAQSSVLVTMVDCGMYGAYPFELFPYYRNGCVLGKPLTMDFIKKGLIPCINDALHTLHARGLFHKDVRPSNFMFLDNWSGAALKECAYLGGAMTGGTEARSLEYAAPETFQNVFLEESDYFAFGVALYELCCGYLPYQNLTPEKKEKAMETHELPFPNTVPYEVKQLILGLTYWDMSKRGDMTNPNRRWTYEEVRNWCIGKSQETPGDVDKLPVFEFMNQHYSDLCALVTAMAENWEEGKKQLFRGSITKFLKRYYDEFEVFSKEAEDKYFQNPVEGDFIYWTFLYQLNPSLSGFFWKNYKYPSLAHLGKEMLKKLRENDGTHYPFWEEILKRELLSSYLQTSEADYQRLVDGVTALEISHELATNTERNRLFHYYTMAYLLSAETNLCVGGRSFENPNQLYEYMKSLVQSSYNEFEQFCYRMIDQEDMLDVQLETWLMTLGQDTEIELWRQQVGS